VTDEREMTKGAAPAEPEVAVHEVEGQAGHAPGEASAAFADAFEARRRRGTVFSRRSLLIAAAAGVLIALLLPIFSTLQPGYYERYPSLKHRMAAWRGSTHAKIACAECHVDPGVIGAVEFAGKAIPAFYEQLVTGPKTTNLLAVPSSAACQKCHTTYRQVSASGDLLIPHRAHVQVLEIRCATCHKDLVHSKNTRGFNSPVMETCLKCHDGKQAANECTACHTRKQVPADHKGPEWLAVHGSRVTEVNCASCHGWTPDYCKDCHSKKPASHAGNFKNDHKARIAAVGEKGCLVCHDEKTFCGRCH
jgi:hypothetical protein